MCLLSSVLDSPRFPPTIHGRGADAIATARARLARGRSSSSSFLGARPEVLECRQLEAVLVGVGEAGIFAHATMHVIEPRRDRRIDVNLWRTREVTRIYRLQSGNELGAAVRIETI